jgi:hypothetical protein
MEVIPGLTTGGLPQVEWTAQLATTTQGDRWRNLWILFGALLGFVGGLVGSGFGAGIAGAVVIGGLFAGSFNKSLVKPGQREWAETPILKPFKGQAFVTRLDNGELMFNSVFDVPDREIIGAMIPLSSFDEFESGMMNDWFASSTDMGAYGNCRCIVVHPKYEGTKCVAVHGGSYADISRLHGELTRQFIARRLEIIKTPIAIAPASSRPIRIPKGRASSDDLPGSL